VGTKVLKIGCVSWVAFVYGLTYLFASRPELINCTNLVNPPQLANRIGSSDRLCWLLFRGTHVVEFGILTFLLLVSCDCHRRLPCLAWATALGLAIIDETIRYFSSGNIDQVTCLAFDFAGIVLAIWTFSRIEIRRSVLRT
jgi:hypothetical protein